MILYYLKKLGVCFLYIFGKLHILGEIAAGVKIFLYICIGHLALVGLIRQDKVEYRRKDREDQQGDYPCDLIGRVAVGVYYIYSNYDAEGGEEYGEVAVVFVQNCEHDEYLNELQKQ